MSKQSTKATPDTHRPMGSAAFGNLRPNTALHLCMGEWLSNCANQKQDVRGDGGPTNQQIPESEGFAHPESAVAVGPLAVDASDRRATLACRQWNQTSVGTLRVDTPQASRYRFPVKREHPGRHRSAPRSLECQWASGRGVGEACRRRNQRATLHFDTVLSTGRVRNAFRPKKLCTICTIISLCWRLEAGPSDPALERFAWLWHRKNVGVAWGRVSFPVEFPSLLRTHVRGAPLGGHPTRRESPGGNPDDIGGANGRGGGRWATGSHQTIEPAPVTQGEGGIRDWGWSVSDSASKPAL